MCFKNFEIKYNLCTVIFAYNLVNYNEKNVFKNVVHRFKYIFSVNILKILINLYIQVNMVYFYSTVAVGFI